MCCWCPSRPSTAPLSSPFVRLLSDGAVVDQLVVLGAGDDFWTVVTEGLQEGDQIIIQSTEAAANQFAAAGNVFRRLKGGGFGGGGGLGGGGGVGKGGQGQP